MKRLIANHLKSWIKAKNPKPLIIRGARQVGKSTLVRLLAQDCFENLIEVNLEENPNLASLFEGNNPAQTVRLLETHFGVPIQKGKSLLFIDELQTAPKILTSLRYFYEKYPGLHVISAGSLLDFALSDPESAVPVGRIDFMFMGPMLFEEYLEAMGEVRLLDFLSQYAIGDSLPEAIHQKFLSHFRDYLIVGGMPESVKTYAESKSFAAVAKVHQSILLTMREDFGKYKKRLNIENLRTTFQALPRLIGKKFKYVHVDRHATAKEIAASLSLLEQARVLTRAFHSSSNGVPLGAEMDSRIFKPVLLDVGLVCASLQLSLSDLVQSGDLLLVNQGALSEQVVGQMLRDTLSPYQDPKLHYWVREKANASSEVDYVIEAKGRVIPIEVKSGKSGSLKSLHVFMRDKGAKLAVRLNGQKPAVHLENTTLPDGDKIEYKLISLPLYLGGQVRRLLS